MKVFYQHYLQKVGALLTVAVLAQNNLCEAQIATPPPALQVGTTFRVQPGATVTVNGALKTTTTGFLSHEGTVAVTGNITADGDIVADFGGKFRLNGTALQTINGSALVSVANLYINNPTGIALNTFMIAYDTVNFQSGIVTIADSNNFLRFNQTAKIGVAPTDASHVNGTVVRIGTGSFKYPTGSATKYQPIATNVTSGQSAKARYVEGNAGTGSFGIFGTEPLPLGYYNNQEYWNVDVTPSGFTTPSATVTIYFDGYRDSIAGTTSDLRVAHKYAGQWQNEGAATLGAGFVTSNALYNFSPFTLGSISGTALAINLVSFAGYADGATNRLVWEAAHEAAGTKYQLERSSDARSFQRINTQNGKGANSNYSYSDEQHPAGANYYRLQIVEQDGSSSYSQVVLLQADAKATAATKLYPSPASSSITISNGNTELTGTPASVVDVQGRIAYRFVLQDEQTIDIRSWVPGLYTLWLADGSATKFIKK